jgi:ACS family glucarate transporter-like MFS transporter
VTIPSDLSGASERPTSVRHLVLAALLVITAINYAQRNAIGPAAPLIQEGLHLTLDQVGLALSAFFLSYTLMQVPAGTLAQRFGAKWTLTLIAAGWSLALAACALARGFVELYAARIALGALQAGIFSCATLILSVWYPASRRGLATALLNSFMLAGGASGSMLTGVLVGPVGWRGVFAAYAVPGLLWAAWFGWWFYSRPQDHPGVNSAELDVIADRQVLPLPPDDSSPSGLPPSKRDERVTAHQEALAERPASAEKALPAAPHPKSVARPSLAVALMSVSLLLICTQQFFRAGASRLFDNWLPTYLVQARGADVATAGILSSMPQWGGVVGGLVGGLLSDEVLRRTGSRRAARKGVALFSLLTSLTCYLIAYSISSIGIATAVVSAGAFLFAFSSPCAYALTMDVGGRYLGVVFGIMNMIGNLGAFTFISVISVLVDWGGWELALGCFAGMHVAAAACWVLLDTDIVIGEDRPAASPE